MSKQFLDKVAKVQLPKNIEAIIESIACKVDSPTVEIAEDAVAELAGDDVARKVCRSDKWEEYTVKDCENRFNAVKGTFIIVADNFANIIARYSALSAEDKARLQTDESYRLAFLVGALGDGER